MSDSYKIDNQEIFRLAARGQQLRNNKAVFKDTKNRQLPQFRSAVTDSNELHEMFIALVEEAREKNKPWIIQEINRWKFWFREKLNK
jgi:hypothetical protein